VQNINVALSITEKLKLKGFTPIGGKSAAGQALLKKTKSFYKK